MEITSALKALIGELKISQTDFSKKTGISQPHLNKILNSEWGVSVSQKTIEKIEDAFNVKFTVESKFVQKGKMNELSLKMLEDNQPFRAMHNYIHQTIACMVGQKDDFNDIIIDENYMISRFRWALDSIEEQLKDI